MVVDIGILHILQAAGLDEIVARFTLQTPATEPAGLGGPAVRLRLA